VLILLAFQVATVIGPTPPPASFVPVHDLATLTDAEARQLASRPSLFRVVVDGDPDGDPVAGWRYDCRGEGAAYRSLRLRDAAAPRGDQLGKIGLAVGLCR
jgi:hypothetical protein